MNIMEIEVVGFDAIKDLYEFDSDFWEVVDQLKNLVPGHADTIQGDYLMQDGYLFKGKQLCILVGSMRENIIWEFHSSGMVGHFGKDKTIALVQELQAEVEDLQAIKEVFTSFIRFWIFGWNTKGTSRCFIGW